VAVCSFLRWIKGKILDRIATAEDQSFAIGGSTNDSKNFVIAGPYSISYFAAGITSQNKRRRRAPSF
jgi:hypothetical protein